MKRVILLLVLAFLFGLIVPCAFAKQGHIPLLAVREDADGMRGSVAELYLDLVPGSGRVFIETFPLTKMDTQISTRFANAVACDWINEDCSKWDFFYTIKADSSIVGGPSAGGAIAVLTAAMLQGINISDKIAITGTINSGGLIGQVGGVKEKISAAAAANITTVLVPKGARFVKAFNLSADLLEWAADRGVKLVEVADLNDVMYEFVGKKFKKEVNLTINEVYIDTMKGIADIMCNRSRELQKKIEANFNNDDKKKATNLTAKGIEAIKNEKYYSAASYCFGANVKWRKLSLKLGEKIDFNAVRRSILEMNDELENLSIKTITDLETYMIVKERLQEASDGLDDAIKEKDEREDYYENLAYAIERFFSAQSWMMFFGTEGTAFKFDRAALKESCQQKIAEAEERIEYVKFMFPAIGADSEDLKKAYKDLESGSYELCLFRASEAKAEADAILSTAGVDEENVDVLIESMLTIVKRGIAEQQAKGIFPILGYSYYEYAGSLSRDDKWSALLFSQYSLELSNLDMYFKEERAAEVNRISEKIDLRFILVFAFGAIFGFAVALLIKLKRIPKKK